MGGGQGAGRPARVLVDRPPRRPREGAAAGRAARRRRAAGGEGPPRAVAERDGPEVRRRARALRGAAEPPRLRGAQLVSYSEAAEGVDITCRRRVRRRQDGPLRVRRRRPPPRARPPRRDGGDREARREARPPGVADAAAAALRGPRGAEPGRARRLDGAARLPAAQRDRARPTPRGSRLARQRQVVGAAARPRRRDPLERRGTSPRFYGELVGTERAELLPTLQEVERMAAPARPAPRRPRRSPGSRSRERPSSASRSRCRSRAATRSSWASCARSSARRGS